MSEYIVQNFFRKENLLSVSVGQDGLLGFFANNYTTIIAMARSIIDQENETVERKKESFMELEDLREELEFLDRRLSAQGYLDDSDQERYTEVKETIEFHEGEIEREDVIFFRGEPLRMCAEYEFIQKLESNFPGMSIALCEFDRLLRTPISSWIAKGLSFATTPVRIIVGAIVSHTNLGVAGSLIYMLVDHYPDIIKQRMQAEMPSGRPSGYPDHEVDGFSIKERKQEVVKKFHYEKNDN